MQMTTRIVALLVMLCALLAAPRLGATMLQRFSLDEMTDNAEKVFRGTVVDIIPGTVLAGGAELPTVTYRLRVDEAFKGSFDTKGEVQVVEIRMLGSLKQDPAAGGAQRLSVLPEIPRLQVGRDYLLLTTPPSAIGLSATVGLGQGCFEIYAADKAEWAKNEFDNAGLYDGAVTYDDLADDIRRLVGE